MKVAAAVLQLVILLFKGWLDWNKDRKSKTTAASKDLAAAIKTRDPAEITKAFDRMKRK